MSVPMIIVVSILMIIMYQLADYFFFVTDYDAEDERPVPLVDDSSEEEIYVGDRHRQRRSSTTKIFWDQIAPNLLKNQLDKFIWHKDHRIHSIHGNANRRLVIHTIFFMQ